MKRLSLIVALGLTLTATSCESSPPGSKEKTPVATPQAGASSIPPCDFEVGDIVTRAGGGAAVPPPGKDVSGNFDGVYQSGSIDIVTSLDGVVTITSDVSGQPSVVETCVLESE
jgi:hypothetical protein